MNDNLYFENVPVIDSLFMEHVLFSYEGIPIVFVCTDKNKLRYLCVCDDVIEEESWLIGRIDNKELLDILMDKITVLSGFVNKKIIIANRKFNENIKYHIEEYNNISKDELPLHDQYLEMKNSLKTYIERIKRDISSTYLTLSGFSFDILNDDLYDSVMVILTENVPRSESYRAPIVNNDTEGFIDSFSGGSIAIKIDYKKYDGEPIEFTEEMISIAYAA